jgi:hypothetical protein
MLRSAAADQHEEFEDYTKFDTSVTNLQTHIFTINFSYSHPELVEGCGPTPRVGFPCIFSCHSDPPQRIEGAYFSAVPHCADSRSESSGGFLVCLDA